MMKELPVYKLMISEDDTSKVEVDYVALVDRPAIMRNFLAFRTDDFVDPGASETESEFIGRCMSVLVGEEGYAEDQAAAICYSKWKDRGSMSADFVDSITDIPDDVRANARNAVEWADKNGWGDCGTAVGKRRASQLADPGGAVSMDTVRRMYSYLSRHAVDLDNSKGYSDGCGKLMYDAWGGKAGLRWAESIMKKNNFAGTKISFDYDDTLTTERGMRLAKEKISAGEIVYIISARQDKEAMLSMADELGIPHDRVYATGSNVAKVAKVKELGISKHYDNNADVIAELGGIGEKFMTFAIQDEDQRIITGPLMLADTPIYRKDQTGEYYVYFDKDTIKTIAQKFFKKGYQSNVNLMHDGDKVVDGLTMYESWITDKSRGVLPMKGFEDVPDGSWFGSFVVDNDQVWAMVKDGKVKGFSVEGVFNYVMTKDKVAEQKMEQIIQILNEL